MDYLPKLATIAQTCEWLHAHTGQTWILPRLLECHLQPYFWLDYKPGNPVEIFGDRKEGFLTSMVFAGDMHRLEVDATDALVTMSRTHDGNLFKTEPPMCVPLSELRFKREAVERVAEIINRQKSTAAPVADSASNDTTPDPERRLARLRALGGNAAYKHSEWKFRGMAALVASEKAEGRTRCDEKTIRGDLKEAAQNELDAKRGGFGAGLGQR